jgi:hypothetical protein
MGPATGRSSPDLRTQIPGLRFEVQINAGQKARAEEGDYE